MPVIAMTREMGSRGKDVAAGIADAVGLDVVHHELVERPVAERLGLSESAVHRFLEGEASLWERWNINTQRLSRYTALEILELAVKGDVIIRGWGAAQLLQGVPGIVCVRVCAPMEMRIAEMKRRMGIGDEDAVRREIERSDAVHDRLVRNRFNTEWRDATDYYMVINTGRMSVESAVGILCDYVRASGVGMLEARDAVLTDELVRARVRAALDETGKADFIGGLFEISVTSGTVRLSGMVQHTADIDEIVAIVEGVEGVTSVTTGLRTLPASYLPYGPGGV